jgi:uncharacterized protein (DUF4415 family)
MLFALLTAIVPIFCQPEAIGTWINIQLRDQPSQGNMNFAGPKDPISEGISDMTTRKPGRPRRKGPTKIPITIRLDMDVLRALKLSGPGWQTRVNHLVRNWILDEEIRNDPSETSATRDQE